MGRGLVCLRTWLFKARFSFLDPWIIWVWMMGMLMVEFSFPLVRTFPIMLSMHVSFMMPRVVMMFISVPMTMVWAHIMMIVVWIMLTLKILWSKSVMDKFVWVLVIVMLPLIVMATIMMKIMIILKMVISMVSMMISMVYSVETMFEIHLFIFFLSKVG